MPCESDTSLAGRCPVSSSFGYFFLYNIRIKSVREKSLLAFASAESKIPPPHLSSYTVRPGQENETFFFFCSRGWFYIVTAGLFHLKNPPDKFYLTEEERIFPADPTFLKKKKNLLRLENQFHNCPLSPTNSISPPLNPNVSLHSLPRQPDSPKTPSGEKPPSNFFSPLVGIPSGYTITGCQD